MIIQMPLSAEERKQEKQANHQKTDNSRIFRLLKNGQNVTKTSKREYLWLKLDNKFSRNISVAQKPDKGGRD